MAQQATIAFSDLPSDSRDRRAPSEPFGCRRFEACPIPRSARALLQLNLLPFILSARLGVWQNRLAFRFRRSWLYLFSQGNWPTLRSASLVLGIWLRLWAGARAAVRCCRARRRRFSPPAVSSSPAGSCPPKLSQGAAANRFLRAGGN